MSEDIHILYKFFGYWQIVVCMFAAVSLLSIQRHITKSQRQAEPDKGLVWLSMAVLVWSLSGIVDVMYASAMSRGQEIDEISYQGLRSLFSIINSAFILMALPQFKHIPKTIRSVVRSDGWRVTVGVSFVLSAVITLLMSFHVIIPSQPNFIYFIDLLYAIFTLSFLGIVLWSSFAKRGLTVLAFLSALSIVFTLLAQFLKLDDGIFWGIFFNCVFKTILIVLFFALALSWVQELSKSFTPQPDDLHLILIKKKNQQGRYDHSAIFSIPPIAKMLQIAFSEATFNLLVIFATKRKHEDQVTGGWLEIQPKSNSPQQYDIKDHKQISRLLDGIFNGIMTNSSDAIELNKPDLRTIMFDQNRQRKIRLRIAPDNIDLSKS